MLVPSPIAAAVVAAVPSLRLVLFRALHASASASAGGAKPQVARYTPLRPRGTLDVGPSSRPAGAATRSPSSPRGRLARFGGPNASRYGLRPGGPAPIIGEGSGRSSGSSSTPDRPQEYPLPPSDLPAHMAEPKRFEAFPLHPLLVDSLKARYGETAHTTLIQSLSLSHLLPSTPPGSRIVLGAETGSGKTLAYLLPIMSQLKETEIPRTALDDYKVFQLLPRAIVLSPTHELTRQSTGMAKQLTHSIKLSAMGMSNTKDGGIGNRKGGIDLLFGTGSMMRRMLGVNIPGAQDEAGRAEKRDWVSTERLEWVVIDEADVLLGRDFRHETLATLKRVIEQKPDVNVLLCTATFPPNLLHHLNHDPILSDKPFTHLLSPALHKLPRNLEARFIPASTSGKPLADVAHEVKRVLAEDAQKRKDITASGVEIEKSKIIIFCNTDKKVQALSKELDERQLPNLAWTGDTEVRIKGSNGKLKSFLLDPKDTAAEAIVPGHAGEPTAPPRILITTGVLSRGLDFSPLVSTVFLVDQPKDVLDFMHRAGRAGRAGRKGRVVVFGMDPVRGNKVGTLGSMVKEVVAGKRDVVRGRVPVAN